MPRDALTAKGLLLASIQDPNPVIFLEPKILYRTSNMDVPEGHFTIPLGQADVVNPGDDITLITYGTLVAPSVELAKDMKVNDGISVEVIDLQTINPFDIETITKSVQKTGKCIITHEAPYTSGFGAELSATLQEECFPYLEAPITRVTGADTPFPLAHEPFYLPNKYKLADAIKVLHDYE